ncbi:cyclic nucleotide-binding protein [Clostridium bornimense]|uniref:Cyclic nucleotide-binding protein n=1 Tax=Clostridium bornimense TaxID=1216932 RepID=W6SJU9_9CLOT|nr:Crp/Fnr family transcriptional regulator [Clostridium bornimense]CDM69990.1 cyclic nucleotide-binding protein [Clostridium bornimense]
MDKLIDKLVKNEIFNEIDSKIIEDIISEVDYYINKYNAGQIIAQEEDNCNALGFILSGKIEIKRIYSCGKEIILNKFGVGEVFGEALIFSKNHNYPATVVALEDTEIFYITKVDMIKLCSKYEKILENFMSLLSDKVIMLNSKIKILSFKSIKHKIVDYILEERKRQNSNEIYLSGNKENIAALLGIPRPSFSRELINLRDMGLISFDRKTIKILHLDKLEEILLD